MKGLNLATPIDEIFLKADKTTIQIKSTFADTFALIERDFIYRFKADLSLDADDDLKQKIEENYPIMKIFSLEEFNNLIYIIRQIRDLCAHLYKNKKIVFDDQDSLITKINNIETVRNSIITNNRLNLYGLVVLTSMFITKSKIHTMVDSLFLTRRVNFQIKNGYMDYKNNFKRDLYEINGSNKPFMFNYPANAGKLEHYRFLNENVRRTLVKIFFEIERIGTRGKISEHASSISYTLSKLKGIKDEIPLIDDLVFLRNCWFHGICLGDEINYKTYKVMNLEFLLSILYELNNLIITKNLVELKKLKKCINIFASSIVSYKYKRLVEKSHKLYDVRLYNPDKVIERSESLFNTNAFIDINFIDNDIINKCFEINKDKGSLFHFNKNQFDDKLDRTQRYDKLYIYYIESKEIINLNGTNLNGYELLYADVVDEEYLQFTVNGMDFKSLKVDYEYDENAFITIKVIKI